VIEIRERAAFGVAEVVRLEPGGGEAVTTALQAALAPCC
jgi:hypothetical protein